VSTVAAEEPITITWAFYYFRRHIDKETKDCIQYIRTYPEMGLTFNEIVSSAGAGICCTKCLACGTNIFGDQALGGIVVIASTHLVMDAMMRFMSPMCKICAYKDLDIIATKCLEYMTSDLFKNATVTVKP
jgi:hypothetical protein